MALLPTDGTVDHCGQGRIGIADDRYVEVCRAFDSLSGVHVGAFSKGEEDETSQSLKKEPCLQTAFIVDVPVRHASDCASCPFFLT